MVAAPIPVVPPWGAVSRWFSGIRGEGRGGAEWTYCYHYHFRVHLTLGRVRRAKGIPFYNRDYEGETYYVGGLPAIDAMRHALKNDLGDERERHIGLALSLTSVCGDRERSEERRVGKECPV